MRLTPAQVETIVAQTAAVAGPSARVWLFGSRLDDAARGGDVDLLIESEPALDPLARARLKVRLEARLGLPVDVLARSPAAAPKPFEALALRGAVALVRRP